MLRQVPETDSVIYYTYTQDSLKSFYRGQYELSNHLGNVLAVITDRRIQACGAGDVMHYEAQVVSASDYYPFGMGIKEREWKDSSFGYRFGFNGQEGDDEVSGEGNTIAFKYRINDTRLGRFFAVDPLASEYPFWTPYQFAGLLPIRFVELEGLEPGESFATQDAAALNFSQLFNDNSIRDNKEYGTRIYSKNSGGIMSYSYTIPVVGAGAAIQIVDLEAVAVPSGTKVTAFAHTHAASTASAAITYDDNNFSGTPGSTASGDIGYAEVVYIDGYVSTPDGSFDKYDVANTKIIPLPSPGVASDTGPGTGVSGTAVKSTSIYTFKSGDSLKSIAERYLTTEAAIQTENSTVDFTKIKSGDTLNVTN